MLEVFAKPPSRLQYTHALLSHSSSYLLPVHSSISSLQYWIYTMVSVPLKTLSTVSCRCRRYTCPCVVIVNGCIVSSQGVPDNLVIMSVSGWCCLCLLWASSVYGTYGSYGLGFHDLTNQPRHIWEGASNTNTISFENVLQNCFRFYSMWAAGPIEIYLYLLHI